MAEMLGVVMRDNGFFFSCGGIKQAVRGGSQPGSQAGRQCPLPPPPPPAAAAGPFQTAPDPGWSTENSRRKNRFVSVSHPERPP